MVVENEQFMFLVTHVESESQFLKIWAQTDERIIQSVTSLLIPLQEKFDYCGAPNIISLTSIAPNTCCCARGINNDFCRVKILNVRPDSMVLVHFIDYGNVQYVPVNNIRLLDGLKEANYLLSIPAAATVFILDVVPIGGTWLADVVKQIRSILVNNKYCGVYKIMNNYKALKFFMMQKDFGQILVDRNMALYSNSSCAKIRSMMSPISLAMSLPLRMPYQPNSMAKEIRSTSPNCMPIQKCPVQKTSSFKAIQLEIGSVHEVQISYVEDGPSKFSVQLVESIPYLEKMMEEINSQAHQPLQEPPIAGRVCLGLQRNCNRMCRVVLNSPGDTSCKVYYADYGHHETLPFTAIYQIPDELVTPNIFSIRFTLSGIMDWIISREMKDYFEDLVQNQHLKLRVCKGPMSPLTQYCDLFANGKNVKDLLSEAFPELCVDNYPEPKRLPNGTTETVFVTYVNSPTKFFIQIERDVHLLEEIMNQIAEVSEIAAKLNLAQIHMDMPCIALYDMDNKWYRASVLNLVDNNNVKVFYVDYGNEEIVSISNLRKMPTKLVSSLPKQAVRCSLYGFKSGSVDKEEITQLFANLVLEERLNLTVQSTSSDNTVSVQLFGCSSSKNIAEVLKSELPANYEVSENRREASQDHARSVKAKNLKCDMKTQAPPNKKQKTKNKNVKTRDNWSSNWEKVEGQSYKTTNFENEASKSKFRKDNENQQRYENGFGKGNASDSQNSRFQSGLNDFSVNDRLRGNSRNNTYDCKDYSGRSNEDNQSNTPSINSRLERNFTSEKIENELEESWDEDSGVQGTQDGETRGNSRNNTYDCKDYSGRSNKDNQSNKPSINSRLERNFTSEKIENELEESWDEDSGVQGTQDGETRGNSRNNTYDCKDYSGRSNKDNQSNKPSINSRLERNFTSEKRNDELEESWDEDSGVQGTQDGETRGNSRNNTYDCKDYSGRSNKDNQSNKPSINSRLERNFTSEKIENELEESWDEDSGVQGTQDGETRGNSRNNTYDCKDYSGRSNKDNQSNKPSINSRLERNFTSEKRNDELEESWDEDSGVQGTQDGETRGNSRNNTYDCKDYSGRSNKDNQSNKPSINSRLERNFTSEKRNDELEESWDEDSGVQGNRDGGTRDQFKNNRLVVNDIDENWGDEESVQNNGSYTGDATKISSSTETNVNFGFKEIKKSIGSYTSIASSKIPPPNITVRAVKNCIMVYYIDPTNFYVQLCPDNKELNTVMKSINSIYSTGGKVLQASDISVDVQCVAQYSEDNEWYRAVIKSFDDSTASVYFIDYGNTESVTFDKIKEIRPELLRLPAQAVPCKLFCPKKLDWTKDESKLFYDEMDGKEVECEFVKEENGRYDVLIKDTIAHTIKFINERFTYGLDLIKEKQTVSNKVSHIVDELPVPDYISPDVKWRENNFDLVTKHDVTVTWFINPESFYCQLVEQQEDFNSMMKEIQDAYQTRHPSSVPLKVGSSVLAVLEADGILYRAEIKEINNSTGHLVQYIDYGDCAIVSPDKIYQVERKFMALPKQAIFCGLNNIAPSDGSDWPNLMKFFDSEIKECVFHTKHDNKYLISLTSNGKDIAGILVDGNLAVHSSVAITTTNDVPEDAAAKQVVPRIDLKLLEGQTLYVKVSSIERADKFYVQFCTADACQENVDSFMATKDPQVMPRLLSHEVCLGVGCLINSKGKWKRGVVINFTNEIYEVRLIDTGELETVSLECMLGLPGQLAVVQNQAIECALFNVPPLKIDENIKESIIGSDAKIFVEKVECSRLIVRLYNADGYTIKMVNATKIERINPVCSMQILNSTHEVIITNMQNSNSIWLQRISETSLEEGLLGSLWDYYSNSEEEEIILQENELYAALSANGNWYRVKVTHVEDTVATVILIDYGNIENIPIQNFRALNNQFYLPHQLGIEVSLTVSLEGSNNDQLEILDPLLKDKTFLATFYNVNRKWIVELTEDGKKISEKLILLKDTIKKTTTAQNEVLETEEMVIGSIYKMVVSHVDNPNQLWVQHKENIDDLYLLQTELQEAAESSIGFSGVPEEKSLCLAMYALDNMWYRAEVLDADNEITTVRFIDYGNTDIIDTAELKQLPEKWKNVKKYAMQCRLDVIPPTNDDWPEEGCTRLSNLILENDLEALIIDTNPMRVDLYIDCKSICEILIREKLAEKYVPSSEDLVEDMEEVQLQPDCALLCNFHSVDEFWVQQENWFSNLRMIEDRLSIANLFPPVTEFKEGLMCVAQYGNEYYRATILSHNEQETNVYYIDYGNSDIVKDLKTIPEDLIDIHPLSRKCCLAKPDGVEHWPDGIDEEFERLGAYGKTPFILDVIEEGETCLVRLIHNSKDVAIELLEICAKLNQKVPENVEETVVDNVAGVDQNVNEFATEADNEFATETDNEFATETDNEFATEADNEFATEADNEFATEADNEFATEADNEFATEADNEFATEADNEFATEADNEFATEADNEFATEADNEFATEADNEFATEADNGFAAEDIAEFPIDYDEKPVDNTQIDEHDNQPSSVGENTESEENLCAISYINSPSEFWIQKKMHYADLDDTIDKLLDADMFDNVVDFKEGKILASKFHEDNKWYRSKILSHGECGTEVYYIDYGNLAFIESNSDLRELPDDLVSLPPLAKKCSLKLPEGVHLSKSACEKFVDLTATGTAEFQFEILDSIQEGSDHILQLSLFHEGWNILEIILNDSIDLQNIDNFMNESALESNLSDHEVISNSSDIKLDRNVSTSSKLNAFEMELQNQQKSLSNMDQIVSDEMISQGNFLLDLEEEVVYENQDNTENTNYGINASVSLAQTETTEKQLHSVISESLDTIGTLSSLVVQGNIAIIDVNSSTQVDVDNGYTALDTIVSEH